jgi:hypothetical protein
MATNSSSYDDFFILFCLKGLVPLSDFAANSITLPEDGGSMTL